MNDSTRVQIVIPAHNRRETTRACLAHLLALEVPTWAGVIVVNDGSTDGTTEMISAEYSWVHIIQGTGTLWWTGAIVVGMRAAIQQGTDCIIWLNDDTLPDQGTLELLASKARTSQAVCGAVCRGVDGRELAYGGGMVQAHWPQPIRKMDGGMEPLQVEWLHGNLVAIPEIVWRRCGLPDDTHLPRMALS
ncbi:MAG: glycosyltransferase [Prosthecobacter sp.]